MAEMKLVKVEEILKGIVDDEGIDYLTREPFSVYEVLVEGMVEPRICRCVLSSLLAGVVDAVLGSPVEMPMDESEDPSSLPSVDSLGMTGEGASAMVTGEELSRFIQRECCFKKSIADQLAGMYLQLFCPGNMTEWQEKSGSGFASFCDGTWEYVYDGECTWHSGGGHVDCDCHVEMDFTVVDSEKAEAVVAKELGENPFLTEDAIYEIFAKKLDDLIGWELEEYVTGDDYYQPYMDDFKYNCEPAVKDFCKECGIEYDEFVCEGSEGEIELDGRW